MSIRVMSRVWDTSKAEGTTLLVLLAIADFADDDGVAFPSVSRLAKKARISDRQVQYHLSTLVGAGELSIKSKAGPGFCNLYMVQPTSPCVVKPIAPPYRNPLHHHGEAHCTSVVQSTVPAITVPVREPSVEEGRFAPTKEQAVAHCQKMGMPFSEMEVRKAWVSFESTKEGGYWLRGRNRVTDWRMALEERLNDNRDRNHSKRPKGPNLG